MATISTLAQLAKNVFWGGSGLTQEWSESLIDLLNTHRARITSLISEIKNGTGDIVVGTIRVASSGAGYVAGSYFIADGVNPPTVERLRIWDSGVNYMRVATVVNGIWHFAP